MTPFSSLRLITLCVFSIFIPLRTPLASLAPLHLGVGEQRWVSTPDRVKRFTLTGSGFRSLAPAGRSKGVLIQALQAGQGSLWIELENGQSLERPLLSTAASLGTWSPGAINTLSHLNTLEVELRDQKAWIQGTVQDEAELNTLGDVRALLGDRVNLQRVKPSPQILELGADRLKRILSTLKEPALHIDLMGDDLTVTGSLSKQNQISLVEKQLINAYPLVLLRVKTLPDDSPTIRLKVFLLEVKRSHFQSLGLNWTTDSAATFKLTPSTFEIPFVSEAKLQALESRGDLHILSRPEIAVRAPGQAELFSGGELPIRSQGRFFSNTQWKPYGLSLKIDVTHASQREVRLEITTELSSLDTQQSVDGTPGLRANRMKTQVDATFGRPLFLSGLLHENTRKEARGLPALRSIPILGALFGSNDYLEERSELVAMILPHSESPHVPEAAQFGLPRGPIPPPRNWIPLENWQTLTQSPDYPWNVLE